MRKKVILSLLFFAGHFVSYSQILDRVRRKVEDKILEKTEEAIDKSIHKKSQETGQTPNETRGNTGTETSPPSGEVNSGKSESAPEEALKAYSKFDFIPGEKVIAFEDFNRVAIGDFPESWNTDGSAEVVTLNKYPGKWLALKGDNYKSYLPEFITDLPENVTVQFDIISSSGANFELQLFNAEPNRRQVQWTDYRKHNGVSIEFLPGWSSVSAYEKNNGVFDTGTTSNFRDFFAEHKNKPIRVSVWRQKDRLRVYVNEHKLYDLPKAINSNLKYNALQFVRKDNDSELYITNLRVAVGAPDVRAKLMNGNFTTNGILFDVNQATIKPESYGILKKIAETLKENTAMKLRIIGHTDSDGESGSNLDLSKRRAEAVKTALASDFGIAASRMETDGKGALQPVAPNTSAEGKANNRRVEFLKVE